MSNAYADLKARVEVLCNETEMSSRDKTYEGWVIWGEAVYKARHGEMTSTECSEIQSLCGFHFACNA